MNNESVKTYTDKETFDRIFNDIFAKFQSFIKIKESAIFAQFINYSDDKVVFEIKDCNETLENCIIISRDDSNNTIFAYLKLLEKKDSITYIFSPVKIQSAFTPRKEERKILNIKDDVNQRIFIINMISEFIIKNSLEFNNKKIMQIENTIKIKLDKTFQHIRTYFIQRGADQRMNYFKNKINPIFISDINTEPTERHKEQFNFYKETIYPDDILLKNQSILISEIAIPIVYRMKIPYGYVQVNNTTQFAESSMQIMKKMASIINELLIKHGIFPQADEKLIVTDISKNGMGIVFKNKQCIKYFNKNQLVYFDLVLPANKKANILALVSNITINGSIYRVGCRIVEIDALSEVYYDEYFELIGSKK